MAITATAKVCRKCGAVKPLDDFHRHSTAPDGRRARCKPCLAEENKVRYDRDPEKHRWAVVRARYGITREDYWNLYDAQDGRCAVCGRGESAISRGDFFCIDHDHETDRVRGLLCTECNLAVGYIESTGATVEAVAAYLQRRG